MTTPLNSTGAHYLKQFTDDEIREGIRTMDSDRRASLIKRHFPGEFIATKGQTVSEALVSADADFQIGKFPIMLVLPPAVEGGEPLAVPAPGRVGLMRTDTHRVTGVASEGYGIVQNRECFAAADTLQREGLLDIAGIQVINGGERVRIMGLFGQSKIDQMGAGPDVLAHFGIFEAAHDGSHSIVGAEYTVRLKCFNGMTSRTKENSFRISHTSKAAERNAEAQKALLTITQAAKAEIEIFQELAQARMSAPEFRDFSKRLLDGIRGELDEEASKRAINRRASDMEELERLFHTGAGNVGVSRYDAYNAVTDFVTPRLEAMRDAKAFAGRFESATTGHNARTKARALATLAR